MSVAAQMQRSNDYQRRSTLAVARLLPPPLPPCVFARTLGLGFSFAARRRDAACSDRLLACQLCTQSLPILTQPPRRLNPLVPPSPLPLTLLKPLRSINAVRSPPPSPSMSPSSRHPSYPFPPAGPYQVMLPLSRGGHNQCYGHACAADAA